MNYAGAWEAARVRRSPVCSFFDAGIFCTCQSRARTPSALTGPQGCPLTPALASSLRLLTARAGLGHQSSQSLMQIMQFSKAGSLALEFWKKQATWWAAGTPQPIPCCQGLPRRPWRAEAPQHAHRCLGCRRVVHRGRRGARPQLPQPPRERMAGRGRGHGWGELSLSGWLPVRLRPSPYSRWFPGTSWQSRFRGDLVQAVLGTAAVLDATSRHWSALAGVSLAAVCLCRAAEGLGCSRRPVLCTGR